MTGLWHRLVQCWQLTWTVAASLVSRSWRSGADSPPFAAAASGCTARWRQQSRNNSSACTVGRVLCVTSTSPCNGNCLDTYVTLRRHLMLRNPAFVCTHLISRLWSLKQQPQQHGLLRCRYAHDNLCWFWKVPESMLILRHMGSGRSTTMQAPAQ